MQKGTPDYIEGLVKEDALRGFLTECFIKGSLKKAHAKAVVDQMMTSSLRGIDTHGAVLTERYLNAIKDGSINTNPKVRKLRGVGGLAVIDGDFAAGQYSAEVATKEAISLASKHGIGAVWVVNMAHCAMLAMYGIMIAKKKMAGTLYTNSNAGAVPLGGTEKVFGTNPFCFSFPYRRFPIVFDGATTAAAGMKIQLAAMEHKPIPAGWAVDEEGRPTTDPNKVGALLPFGGHKGYSLMFMVEMFSAVLAGGDLSRELKYRDAQGGLYVQAIDIGKLRDSHAYSKQLDRLVSYIKASEKPGGEKVYLPGEIEYLTSERRLKEGIPLHKDIWRSLTKISKDLGVALPELDART
jgi:ureidoglycolate dehydrogenase (NAD+)